MLFLHISGDFTARIKNLQKKTIQTKKEKTAKILNYFTVTPRVS
jgi:hypothetical protein